MTYLAHVFSPSQCIGASLLCGCLFLGLGLVTDAANAESKKKTLITSLETKKKGSVKIKHQHSASEESTSEPERRLFRECKGRPNAGVCLGFTHR